jgi:hypothetical protein
MNEICHIRLTFLIIYTSLTYLPIIREYCDVTYYQQRSIYRIKNKEDLLYNTQASVKENYLNLDDNGVFVCNLVI